MCSAALRDPCATPWLRSVDDESDDGDDWIKCWSSQAATRERHARRRRRAPHHSGHVGKIPVKLLILVLSALLLLLPQNNSYRDLNKNGRMDVYENSNAAIDARVEDLLSQMTLEEKTCQTATLYGYKRVLQDELPTANWKNEIWKDGIANIDEHLNGWGPGAKSVYANDIEKHVWAMNETQRFFVEQTRLGIPVDFTNEGLRGVAFTNATGFPS